MDEETGQSMITEQVSLCWSIFSRKITGKMGQYAL